MNYQKSDIEESKKFRSEEASKPSKDQVREAVRTLIRWAGDDPTREGLIETPERVLKAYSEWFSGYDKDVSSILEKTFGEVENYDQPVSLYDIPFESYCEHHLAPIIGFVNISYIPKGRVVGISKLARVVDVFSKRLQVQEKMTAQIANGGYKIYPYIIADEDKKNQPEDKFTPLFENPKHIEIVQDAMFGSTNEVMGTSYRSRIDDLKYQFAGKTGTAQVKKITEQERELDLKTFEIPYEQRDHALYIAFGPYRNPRYALSILIEHGGNGSTTAAPMAKKLFKLIIDRHKLRQSMDDKRYLEV